MAFSLPIRIPFLGKPRVRSEFKPMVPMVLLPLFHWQSENSERILAANDNFSAGYK